MSKSPHREALDSELELSLRPRVHITFAFLGALMVCAGALFLLFDSTSEMPGAALTMIIAGASGGILSFAVFRRRRATLWVGEDLRYRRGRTHFELPRSAAVAVFIARPDRRLINPTTYSLRVELKGQSFNLPFAEHWQSGARAARLAEQLAKALEVPVEDPKGEVFRASSWRIVRWMGHGEEWKFLPLVLGAGIVAVVALRGCVGWP